ncbi:DUF2250 domain-containing protein [Thermosulfuriphilus sp.]
MSDQERIKHLFKDLSPEEKTIVFDLQENGPDCAKFISRRLRLDLSRTMVLLKGLEEAGILERVKGTFLKKKGFYRPKHMNHTYYKLTRPTKLYLRSLLKVSPL